MALRRRIGGALGAAAALAGAGVVAGAGVTAGLVGGTAGLVQGAARSSLSLAHAAAVSGTRAVGTLVTGADPLPVGQGQVWRTRDGGGSWQRLSDGLPQRDAYLTVLREAMAIDPFRPAGVYFGTSTGQLWRSLDEGETWAPIATTLPSIWSVDVAVVD